MTPLKEALAALEAVSEAHAQFFRAQLRIRSEAGTLSQSDRVDCSIVTKHTAKLIEDVRSECNRTLETIARFACLAWITEADPPSTLRGTLGSGTPDVKEGPQLPKHGTDEYNALMEWLGIPPTAADAIRPHWPTLTERITELAKAGQSPPSFISRTFTQYVLTTRARRDAGLPGSND